MLSDCDGSSMNRGVIRPNRQSKPKRQKDDEADDQPASASAGRRSLRGGASSRQYPPSKSFGKTLGMNSGQRPYEARRPTRQTTDR